MGNDSLMRERDFLIFFKQFSKEIETHLGITDKHIAEFVIDLANGKTNPGQFQQTLMSKGVNLPELLVMTLFNLITSFCSAMIMTEDPRTNVSDRRSKEKRNVAICQTVYINRNFNKRSQKTNEINHQAPEDLNDSSVEKLGNLKKYGGREWDGMDDKEISERKTEGTAS